MAATNDATNDAFVSALSTGLTVRAITAAAAAAVLAFLMIERNAVATTPAVPEPQLSGETAAQTELAA